MGERRTPLDTYPSQNLQRPICLPTRQRLPGLVVQDTHGQRDYYRSQQWIIRLRLKDGVLLLVCVGLSLVATFLIGTDTGSIAGNIFLGYLNLPEATEKAFSEINGKRFFHTGDLARRLPDGNLEYINRKDWMVKVNGQRVEPGEIEHAMASCPGVSTAVVKSFENEQGQTFLCGYYVAREPVEEGRLRSWLKDLVPDYMVPQFLVHMDTFPLNANGKIDRLSLVKPDVSSYQAAYIPPENDAQQQLCAAFETLLSLERVGIHDDFFALGGDSIKAVRLQGLCPSLPLEVMDIFEGRTPEGIAQRLDARGISGAKEEDVFAGCSNEPMPVRLLR